MRQLSHNYFPYLTVRERENIYIRSIYSRFLPWEILEFYRVFPSQGNSRYFSTFSLFREMLSLRLFPSQGNRFSLEFFPLFFSNSSFINPKSTMLSNTISDSFFGRSHRFSKIFHCYFSIRIKALEGCKLHFKTFHSFFFCIFWCLLFSEILLPWR